jgi:CubicO group peptidase (beta-lactamase class C family)
MRKMRPALFGIMVLMVTGSVPYARAIEGAAATSSEVAARKAPAQSVQEREDAVTKSLLPAVVIKGRSGEMRLADRMEHYKIPGVSIAVINEGRVEWARGFGVKEAGRVDPVAADTLFQAGSISKPVAAMAALRLVQEGKVDLDSDVNDRLKTWKVPENEFTKARKVTLRQLLSHTAGMTVHGFPGYDADGAIPTLLQVLDGTTPANTAAIRVDIAPGTLWRYSGGGYTVMQQLLIDVTGKSFPEVLRENVTGKIGMSHSTYEEPLPERLRSKAATAHIEGKPGAGKYHTYPEMAAAGLWTTPGDLAQFAIEIQKSLTGKSNKVLSVATIKQMLTPVMNGYGLGLTVAGEGDSVRFGHNGDDFGFNAQMIAYEKNGQGAVVMTNGANGQGLCGEIVRAIARVYKWPSYPMPKEKETAAADVQQYKQVAGKYQLMGGLVFSVTEEDGKLFGALPSQPKEELIPEPNGSFFTMAEGIEVTFLKDDNGTVTGIVAVYGEQRFTLKRVH